MTTKKISSTSKPSLSESLLKYNRRNTERIFTSEEEVPIAMGAIRCEQSIVKLFRKYSIFASTYYTNGTKLCSFRG
jgi:ISCc3, transposase orfA